MSRILVLSLIVASVSTIVGCGASASANVNVAGSHDEACWTPPDEMAVSIAESKDAKPAQLSHDKDVQGSYRPNRNDRPTSGAVHAATY